MTGGSPFPFLQVQVAFASNPLSGIYTWNDISSNVTGIQITRGRQHVLNSFQPGTLSVTLDGRDGIFDPTNPNSTYYPNVDINRRVQVLAWWNLLSSSAGGNTITSGWTPAASSTSVGYFSGHMEMSRTSGTGNLTASSASSTFGFTVYPNMTYSGMALFQASSTSGSANVALHFWNSAGAWMASSQGATVIAASSATIQATASSTAPTGAAFGALTTNVLAATAGLKYAVTQPGVVPSGSSANYTWYAGGGQPIYTGFTDSWMPQWDSNLDTSITMTATDGLRLLAQEYIINSGYPSTIAADGATHFWRFNEASGPTAVDSIASSGNGTYSATGVTYGAAPIASSADPNTTTSFDLLQGGGCQIPGGAQFGGATDLSLECWFKSAANNLAFMLYTQGASSGASQTRVFLDGNGKINMWFINSGTTIGPTAAAYNDSNWHHLVLSYASSSGATTLYMDGTTASSAVWPTGGGTNTTVIHGWGYVTYPGLGAGQTDTVYSIANGAFYASALSATQALNHYNMGLNGWLAQDTGARETAVLLAGGWPTADQNISAGQSQVQVPTSPLSGVTTMGYMQSVEQAENGALFINGSGKVVFQNRYTILTGPNNVSLVTFGDNAGEILYKPSPTVALDDIDLYNISSVTRNGGMTQIASNSTSITRYGASSSPQMGNTLTESGLLITTDNESLARAQWNVSHYNTPLTRVRQLTVDVLGDIVNRFPQTVLRELRDRVTVHRRPYTKAGGWPVSQFAQDSYIEGITHNIDPTQGTWTVTLALSPAETQSYWILGDATYGVLDSTTRLAY